MHGLIGLDHRKYMSPTFVNYKQINEKRQELNQIPFIKASIIAG